MLDQKLAEAMQRVLSQNKKRFQLNATFEKLLTYGIGTKKGKSVYFTDTDKINIKSWLSAKGYTLQDIDMSGMTRSERLAFTPNEKAGGENVKRNRISVKVLKGKKLILENEEPISLPDESHLDVDWKKISAAIKHNCIMMIENYESFNLIHEIALNLPLYYCNPLIIYRGDRYESRFDNVQNFLSSIKLPVIAFVDADPAGIAMASQLPNFMGILLPAMDVLEEQLKNPQTSRKDLFIDQYLSCKNLLEGLSVDHPCARVWRLLLKYAAGIVQERWISDKTKILSLIN